MSSHQSIASQVTVDAPRGSDAYDAAVHANVELVEGSSPQLTNETQGLLRYRLRAASLLLFAGFLAFLVQDFFLLEQIKTPLDWGVFWAHAACTVLTGVIGLGLCRQCSMSTIKLRIAEALIFGGPMVFFMLMQYAEMTEAAQLGYMPSIVGPWLVLMFTYALFVPNTWPRAAAVIGTMAVLPVVLCLAVRFTSTEFAEVLSRPHFGGSLLAVAMIMLLSSAIAIFGVASIGSLRREAFEARRLGQYHLKHQIGAGGMGEVYLAEHQLMKRPCAIKVIRAEKAGDPRVLARFEREVRATAKLSHWNTVEIFDYGRADDGTFYYVMEYLPGMNLDDLVHAYGPMPPERVIHLLAQTCDALAEAHSKQLIHRDLKPGNIFAAYRGGVFDVAKLLDFGLVKPLLPEGSATLTQEGAVTGSPLYMSPEQASGEHEADARSDIYSLGAVAYLLLTGRPPFDYEQPIRVMVAHAHDPVVPPSELVPEIPEDLELVVLRCLAKDPVDRWQDAQALRQALDDCNHAGHWNRESARAWWECNGCPKKRALDKVALHEVSV